MYEYLIETVFIRDVDKQHIEKGIVVADNLEDAYHMIMDAYALKWNVEDFQLYLDIFKDGEIVLLNGDRPEIFPKDILNKRKLI